MNERNSVSACVSVTPPMSHPNPDVKSRSVFWKSMFGKFGIKVCLSIGIFIYLGGHFFSNTFFSQLVIMFRGD